MSCNKIEKMARTIVGWVLSLAFVTLLNAFLIAMSTSSGGPWWAIHAMAAAFIGVVAAIAWVSMWLQGDVSICRKR
jgi:hypothetical protein